jgi:hypothetical protein
LHVLSNKYIVTVLSVSLLSISGCGSTTTGGSSGAVGNSGTTNLVVTSAAANDIAWDPVSQRIYYSVPTLNASPTTTDSVGALDPLTGKVVASVSVGGNPHPIAISGTGKYVYVGLNDAFTVQRLTLPALTPDIRISFGNSTLSGPFLANNIQAAPNGADATIAVSLTDRIHTIDVSGGVAIYDDTIRRTNALCGSDYPIHCVDYEAAWNTFQWNATGDAIIAASSYESPSTLRSFLVDSSGFVPLPANTVAGSNNLGADQGQFIHYDSTTGLIYNDNGAIVDPVTLKFVGSFKVTKPTVMIPDGKRGKAYFIVDTSKAINDPILYAIETYDINTHALISTVQLGFAVVGQPKKLIRWGTNGLAFLTVNLVQNPVPGAIFLISDSSF